ncbi:allophanate hydrolase subunit 1 [Corynebacterium deserti GIMN1.010]|uniref:Allophanate hydrolase subunit 1 n=1 Tax=Corynebacterium deserti GIMN1.010 TaxID=931089 RepID=A0A0M4CX26_9CORY|nr:allophanate hydrolase subunit 1 [Corynebacterium deserti]ALC05420.1 allophanate hydrolase subunit 1 [Corynebacterium deserti GIMN1.010]
MRVNPCGDQAVIIDLLPEDAHAVNGTILDAVLALNSSIMGRQIPGIVDTVPAAQSLLVTFDTQVLTPEAFTEILGAISLSPDSRATSEATETIEIPVTYDGPDLEDVAKHTGLSVAEVISTHQATTWTAAFGGFAPGFYYLIPNTPLWDIPRLQTPRTKIPAGSVGLAGEFSAVYPQQSPGGWQLLGTTDIAMWDLDRWQPSLLKPGNSVRFVQVK